ncbi:hypothetical protein, partial [Streptomyces anulatus]|uniref:hypothetical protein n=1 Tax=Streptomyces anulatus TaxID=1892 RepID=UPI0036AE1DDF
MPVRLTGQLGVRRRGRRPGRRGGGGRRDDGQQRRAQGGHRPSSEDGSGHGGCSLGLDRSVERWVDQRAIAAAQAAASVPDHARLDQVFDVFAEGGSRWIVS